MIKRHFLFMLILISACMKQDVDLGIDLPKVLNEVSGNEIINASSSHIYMHNDSGDDARLFCVNKNGKLHKTLYLDANNKDWEDITSDPEGNLYIGDFGNNNNSRKDLNILKVPFSALNSNTKIKVENISFQYEDQKKFPPKKEKRFFDCEAFFYYDNELFILTKSRVEKNHGKTNLYKIPAKKGKHVAKYIGSYNFGDKPYSWVTGVDIRDDGKEVAVLTQRAIWLFTKQKTHDNFFKNNPVKIPFKHITQKEGVCYNDNKTLYVTDENDFGRGGNLYTYKIN